MLKKGKVLLALALAFAFALLPAIGASATVISGWTSKVDYDNIDPDRYVIDIDITNQIITVYDNYLGGQIAVQGLCTTGNKENPTNYGTYKIGNLKERFGYFVAYGQYAQYWTQVVRGIYIHSIMYNSTKLSSMSKNAYRDLGSNVSHGCVRTLPHIAQFIYYNCPPGTTCNVVKNRAADPALVASVKAGMPSYSNYVQPADNRAWPDEVPGVIRYNNVELRTGFSASKDTTVEILNSGAKILLLQLGSDWCKVRTEDKKLGYVKTQYILAYPDDPAKSVTTYKTSSKTYVYESMDTGSKRLVKIASGAEVYVQSNPQKGWYYGNYSGTWGYLRTKYVKTATVVNYPTLNYGGLLVSTGTDAAALSGTRVRADIRATMRAEASSSSAAITVLEPNTEVSIISVVGNWYYCTANGYTGYVFYSCLVTA